MKGLIRSLCNSPFLAVPFLLWLVPFSAAQLYTVTDLHTLPGVAYSVTSAINSLGQVVGSADIDTGKGRAFLWTRTRGMQDLGTLPGGINEAYFSSGATGINDLGHVSGWSWLDIAYNAGDRMDA